MRDDTSRLVTLTGPGSVGKTRLALAVSEEAIALLRSVGDEAFAEAWATGRDLPAEEAADLPRALGLYASPDDTISAT